MDRYRGGSCGPQALHCNQTTASVDNLQFKEAVRLNDTLILLGKITYVGHTSMEVQVDSYVEDLDGTRKLVNTAFLLWSPSMKRSPRSGTGAYPGDRRRKSGLGIRGETPQ